MSQRAHPSSAAFQPSPALAEGVADSKPPRAPGQQHALGDHGRRAAAFVLALGIGWLGHGLEPRSSGHAVESAGVTADPLPAGGARITPDPAGPEPRITPDPSQPAARITPDPSATPTAHETGPFSAEAEAGLLDALRAGDIVRVKKGTGGRSLAFKLTFADGSRGYFKPEQDVSSANWYAEVAAYYLDRALGLGRVPPVVSKRVAWRKLAQAAEADPRVAEVAIAADGSVRGALIHWLPQKLTPAVTPPGWENWLRLEPFAPAAVSPYQRAAVYVAELAAARGRAARSEPGVSYYRQAPEPARAELPAELSDMIVFDFLTLNYDRWGGDNTNTLTLGADGPLIFLDNGDGFSVGPARRSVIDARLAPVQRFRKRTIEALRALDVPALGRTLAADALAPILSARMLEHLELRRQAVLDHVAAQERRFGAAVYAW